MHGGREACLLLHVPPGFVDALCTPCMMDARGSGIISVGDADLRTTAAFWRAGCVMGTGLKMGAELVDCRALHVSCQDVDVETVVWFYGSLVTLELATRKLLLFVEERLA